MQSCSNELEFSTTITKSTYVSTLLLNVNGHQKDKTKDMNLTAKSK